MIGATQGVTATALAGAAVAAALLVPRGPAPAGSGPTSGPGVADEIAAEALRGFAAAEGKLGPDGRSRSTDAAHLAWGESYVLMAQLAMYEGTGQQAYVDRFLTHCDRILANRDDRRGVTDEVRGRVMPSWSTGRYSGGKRYAWIVHAGMITYPMARWLYLAKRDPILRKRHAERIARYEKDLTATAGAFEPSWRDGPGKGEGHYVGRYLRRRLPLNQQNALGRTFVALYLATGKAEHRARAERLARFFQNRIRRVGDRCVWSYTGGSGGAEDISHAAINADFAFACFRAGIVFDRADMQAMARTFHRFVRDGGFAAAIDGSGQGGAPRAPQAGRWLHLAFFDPELRTICHRYYRDKWSKHAVASMLAAAYLVETARPLRLDRPVSAR